MTTCVQRCYLTPWPPPRMRSPTTDTSLHPRLNPEHPADPTTSQPPPLTSSTLLPTPDPHLPPHPTPPPPLLLLSQGKYDAILVSGSRHSAYEDLPWINRLADVLRSCVDRGSPRIAAVCFGHQLLAQALGGKVGKNPSGR